MSKNNENFTVIFTRMWNRHSLYRSEVRQMRYLPQSVKLEEAVNPHMISITMITISAALLVFFIWSSWATINEVARAQGVIVPRGFTQVVQHMDGGMITEILTTEGALVKAGQILVKIDDGGAREDMAEVKARQQNLQIKIIRLRAFLDGVEPDFSAYHEAIAKEQQRVFSSMVEAIFQEKMVINKQISQREHELKSLETHKITLEKNLKIAVELFKISENLKNRGSVSKKDYLEAKRDLNDLEGQLNEVKSDIGRAFNAMGEYSDRLLSLTAMHRDNAYKEMNQIQNDLEQNTENLRKLTNRVARLDVKSPVYGLVKGMNLNTIGGVIAPASTLMEIVPLDKNLVVDARILPNDVGHVRVGQLVRVKVSSFDFSRYGAVDGTLEFISATTFLDNKNQPYYRGRIALSQNYVGNSHGVNNILPGMTVEADIITGSKSVLSYLLKPIHLSIKTAMTER